MVQILISLLLALHPYFVSMTEIKFNASEKKLELSIRIFTDDLEKTLSKSCNCKMDLIHIKDSKEYQMIMQEYLNRHLILNSNQLKIKYTVIGYEKEEESIWIYAESDQIVEPTQLIVQNTLLHDYTDKQINLVRFISKEKDKTKQLKFPEKLADFP